MFSLRTRIAVTFLVLLAAVLTAALSVVSAANRSNAEREVRRQLSVGSSVFSRLLESDRRQLKTAAKAVADDYAFREAVATGDTDTSSSALENGAARIGAAMAVLSSMEGKVIASYGKHAIASAHLPQARDGDGSIIVDDGRIYQLVTVAVRSPLPVALVTMGFELDAHAAQELADVTGLAVTFSYRAGGDWKAGISTAPAARAADVIAQEIEMSKVGGSEVRATLSRSLADARAPFERLSNVLIGIAIVSVAVAAAAILWLSRGITQPLRELTNAVDKIRGGSYDVSVRVQRRDELGVLAEGLQLMQSAVLSRDRSIRQLAYEDPLTGLMNRTAFVAAVGEGLNCGESALGVAVINLHRFRRINEHLGYSVGDAVLTKIGVGLASVPSVKGAVARLAADQFAAFTRLPENVSLQLWGASLLEALSEPVLVESQPIDLTASVGLAVAGDVRMSADELMVCADLALERARRDKLALAVYDPALKPMSRDQLSLLGELRRAIEQDELRLYFQPKIELGSQRVAGAEVLLRWQHPTRGLLSPASFIPFAEQTGFIRRLTRWTLDRAIAQGAAWFNAGKPLSLAVNISADDVGDARLDSRVATLISRHQLPPSLLTLEVTESGFIEDPNRALRILDALAALGVLLSIDDFGTGYSSLSHLARMPVHEVKIDRSFVTGLESNVEFAAIVRSAIEMGHSLGLKVVAEGIETDTAALKLRSLGCDIVQGYLYAQPMCLADLEKWLQSKARVRVNAQPVNLPVGDIAETATRHIF
ncbi:MAG TPA: EAL domain-containing protein [Steroidobacteraceae bacterium]|jgi:diguanylate cyclase (GGDEF)-like protein|nr:EAL domain-containing protein [Steroidobacteraceae bacterium]